MTTIKLNIKLGALELNYEGPQDFAGDGIEPLIQYLAEVNIPQLVAQTPNLPPASTGQLDARIEPSQALKLSTTDFAVKMGAKSGTDLVMAAAAYLHHTQGAEEFRRSDLLSEMKASKAFYRASYGGNLTKSLDLLTKSGRLQNPKADTYALPYSEIERTKVLL